MSIRLKRAYDDPAANDGNRVLVAVIGRVASARKSSGMTNGSRESPRAVTFGNGLTRISHKDCREKPRSAVDTRNAP